ncbi:heme-dependent oxidative N-demethylase subunit alpha family protein, partial [Acinetobacter baumannii]
GELVHLRVELQPLHRLPRSNAIVFPVRTYFMSMNELVGIPKWARRMHRVMRDIRPELADYKGFARYRPALVEFLSRYDDGAPTSPGMEAE